MPPAWRLMARLRLRTQLLVGTLLIICALLGSLLVIVRHIVRAEIADGVQQSTDASLHAFENVQRQRDIELSRTAALMAELPPLKGVLETQQPRPLQDASDPVWKMTGSPLFGFASPAG